MRRRRGAHAVVGSLHVAVVDRGGLFEDGDVVRRRAAQHVSVDAVGAHQVVRHGVVEVARRAAGQAEAEGVHVALDDLHLPRGEVFDVQVVQLLARGVDCVGQVAAVFADQQVVHRHRAGRQLDEKALPLGKFLVQV